MREGSSTTQAAWAQATVERAQNYWTLPRLEALSGGRQLWLHPIAYAALLRAIGLLHRDGSMPPHCVRKYWQVSHAVRILEPLLDLCGRAPEKIRVIDAGCGRSYLSLVLACRARQRGLPLQILGIDMKEGLVRAAHRRAQLAGLGDHFRVAVASLSNIDCISVWRETFGEEPDRFDGIMALHACDTATCDSIVLGVSLDVRWMALAPCCQAELSARWTALASARPPSAPPSPYAPIHQTPHLSRQIAAHTTDMFRTLLMRASGWSVTPMEFVAAEHTPKNTLLRAIRADQPDPGALSAYHALVAATGGAGIALASRLSLDLAT